MNEKLDKFVQDIKDSISLYQIGVQDEEGTVRNFYRDVAEIAEKLREFKENKQYE
jgi:hypothetical protein